MTKMINKYSVAFLVLAAFGLAPSRAQCLQSGLQCSEEDGVIFSCLEEGAEAEMLVECSAEDESCPSINCDPTDYVFECLTSGIIPDAANCSLAHVCESVEYPPIAELLCPGGFIQGTSCIEQCPREVVTCDVAGENDRLDAEFCFVCDEFLNPVVYRCGEGLARAEPPVWGPYEPPGGSESCGPVGTAVCSPDCMSVLFCTPTGNITVQTCTGTTKCNSTTLTCVDGTTCTAPPPSTVTCIAPGLFPDPRDCSKAYLCLPDLLPPATQTACASGVLSSSLNECLDAACPRTTPTCTKPYEIGSLDATYCYLCDANLVPTMVDRCSNLVGTSTSSSATTGSSTPSETTPTTVPTAGTTETPSSTPTTPTTVSSTPTTVPSTPTTVPSTPTTVQTTATTPQTTSTTVPSTSTTVQPPPTCTRPNQAFPDATDCHYYWLCSSQMIASRRKCPATYFFSQSLSQCVNTSACPQ